MATLSVKGQALGIALVKNGQVCVIAGSQGQVRTWDVGQWNNPRATVDEKSLMYALAAAPDGESFVTAEPSWRDKPYGRILWWSVDPLKRTKTWTTPAGIVSVAFSPDGKYLASGDEAGNIELRNVESGVVTASLTGHVDQVLGVAFTPDGNRLLSGSYDKTVRLWDIASRATIFTWSTHRGLVREVAVSRDGRLGASASTDETIKCYDLISGEELTTYSRHTRGAHSVEFLPDGSGLVSGGENGRIAVWPLRQDEAAAIEAPGASAVAILSDKLTALCAANDGVTQIDLATMRILRKVATPAHVTRIALSADDRTAILGGVGGMLQLLDLDDFTLNALDTSGTAPVLRFPPTTAATKPSTRPAVYKGSISALAMSPTEPMALIGGSEDEMFSLISLGEKRQGFTRRTDAKGIEAKVTAACFTPDGRRVLIAVDRTPYLIEVASGVGEQLKPSSKMITAVALSADGKLAALGSYDSTVSLWDVHEKKELKLVKGHLGPVTAVAFTPDARTVVAAGMDNTIRMWDVQENEQIRCWSAHRGAITDLSVSRDGLMLVSASSDGTVRRWDLSRPVTYRSQEDQLRNLYEVLDAKPTDAPALASLAQWYALRGRADWAAECLEQARAARGDISPLMLARCYWTLQQFDAAEAEFKKALLLDQAPDKYLNLCIEALRR
jgi:WD40 repeat protein